MKRLSLIIVIAIFTTGCGSNNDSNPQFGSLVTIANEEETKPEDNIESYTGDLWRASTVLLEVQYATELNALDIGPFLEYNRILDATVLPENIVLALQSIDISLPPDEFPFCVGGVDEMFVVRVTDSNGDLRQYVDERACNLQLIADFPQPDEIVGILVHEQLLRLRELLLEFDPRVTNP